jgi:hypothetical protein
VDCTDTRIGTNESDTLALGVACGLRVRVCAGQLNGLEGTIVNRRPNGNVLVRSQHGVYVEVPRFLLQVI